MVLCLCRTCRPSATWRTAGRGTRYGTPCRLGGPRTYLCWWRRETREKTSGSNPKYSNSAFMSIGRAGGHSCPRGALSFRTRAPVSVRVHIGNIISLRPLSPRVPFCFLCVSVGDDLYVVANDMNEHFHDDVRHIRLKHVVDFYYMHYLPLCVFSRAVDLLSLVVLAVHLRTQSPTTDRSSPVCAAIRKITTSLSTPDLSTPTPGPPLGTAPPRDTEAVAPSNPDTSLTEPRPLQILSVEQGRAVSAVVNVNDSALSDRSPISSAAAGGDNAENLSLSQDTVTQSHDPTHHPISLPLQLPSSNLLEDLLEPFVNARCNLTDNYFSSFVDSRATLFQKAHRANVATDCYDSSLEAANHLQMLFEDDLNLDRVTKRVVLFDRERRQPSGYSSSRRTQLRLYDRKTRMDRARRPVTVTTSSTATSMTIFLPDRAAIAPQLLPSITHRLSRCICTCVRPLMSCGRTRGHVGV